MNSDIRIFASDSEESWKLPVVWQDEAMLALDKPSGLACSPDPAHPEKPDLTTLLHRDIADAAGWAKRREIDYLAPITRLDPDESGVFLLARSPEIRQALADLLGSEKPVEQYLILVHGCPDETAFEITSKLAPTRSGPDRMRVNPKQGKKTISQFRVIEQFQEYTLLTGEPLTHRRHQLRAHLRYRRLPVVGDDFYGGAPLWLSRLKPNFRLKRGKTERPLIGRAAVHLEQIILSHPLNGEPTTIRAAWPKDFEVGLKYLRLLGK